MRRPLPDTPVIPLILIITGTYLSWFGVHYWRSDVKWPSDPVKAVLTGKPVPKAAPATPALHYTTTATGGLGVVGQVGNAVGGQALGPVVGARGDLIAKDALQYQGAGYAWGGNASSIGNWDCSSFVSKVLGGDLGMELPGGGHWGDPGYPPNSHGPGSTAYMLYGDGVELANIAPGDLIVSTEHIGICIGNGQMISAEDPQDGTRIGTFPDGFPAGPPVYRRPSGAGRVPAGLNPGP